MSKNFDTSKSLDQLEQKVWGEPEFNSSLVLNCHRLRKVPLNQFTTEDFRLMISQDIGLDFLMPPAIEILTENPLISGNYYKGDLLNSVLSVNSEFWRQNVRLWQRVEEILTQIETEQDWIRKTVLANADKFRHESFSDKSDKATIFSYHNRIFKSVANSETGEVSSETTFYYRQKNKLVWVEYSGGEIVFGTLIAKVLDGNLLEMRYQHLNKKGELMTGKCLSTPQIMPNGKIRLDEKWQWTCGDLSTGESIIEEI